MVHRKWRTNPITAAHGPHGCGNERSHFGPEASPASGLAREEDASATGVCASQTKPIGRRAVAAAGQCYILLQTGDRKLRGMAELTEHVHRYFPATSYFSIHASVRRR